MRLVALRQGPRGRSLAVMERPEPTGAAQDDVHVRTLEVGICGTDMLLLDGAEGEPPAGDDLLIIGHEGLGRVSRAPAGSDWRVGDLVVCRVREPDPVPCEQCGARRQDLCVNGLWRERGIRGLHGFMRDVWTVDGGALVRVDERLRTTAVLLEPLSVVVKAFEEIDAAEAGHGGKGEHALVVGAGAIGLLATAMFRLQNRSVLVVDKLPAQSERARIAKALGATYLSTGAPTSSPYVEALKSADVIVDAAGAQHMLIQALQCSKPNSVTAVLGSSTSPTFVTCDVEPLFSEIVQANKLIFGSVSASQQHLERAVMVLARIVETWPGLLDRTILRVPVNEFQRAFSARQRRVKVAICFST